MGISQPWSVASYDSVWGGGKAWNYHSAVCWWYGQGLYTALGNNTPIGLIVSAVSSTSLQLWQSPEAEKMCPIVQPYKGAYQQLWNSMIYPMVIGPLALSPRSSVVWYQGENNEGQDQWYTCGLQANIKDWRAKFGLKDSSAFIVVGLSAWNASGTNWLNVPLMRGAQIAALTALPSVGYAASYDNGDLTTPWSGHPRYKQPVGQRATAAALGVGYGWDVPYQGPTYQYANASRSSDGANITP